MKKTYMLYISMPISRRKVRDFFDAYVFPPGSTIYDCGGYYYIGYGSTGNLQYSPILNREITTDNPYIRESIERAKASAIVMPSKPLEELGK